MSKRFLSIAVVMTMTLGVLVTSFASGVMIQPVQAESLDQCQVDAIQTVRQLLNADEKGPLRGYLKQLSDLLSTHMPTYLLIDEVQQLVRDARIEMRGVCEQVARFDEMNEMMAVAYSLQSCESIPPGDTDTQKRQDVVQRCFEVADGQVNALMDNLAKYMVTQAVRTASEPVVERLRALNGKLTVLMSSYSRLVNNFFTFSFRLGGVITGERD